MSGLKLVIKLPKPSGSGQAAGRPADRESDPGQQQREPKRRRSQPEGAPKAKKPRREAGGEAAPTLEAPRPGPASDPARPGPQPERGAQGGAGEAPKPRLVIKFKAPQQPAAATGAPPAQQSAAPGGSQAPGEPRKKKKKKRPRPPEGQQPPQGQGQAAPAPAPAPRSEDGGAQQPAPPPRLPPKMRAAVPASAAAPAAARPPSAASAVGPAAAAAASAPSSSGRPVKTEQPPPAKVSALPKKLPAKLPAAKAEPPQAASGLSSAVASAAAGAPGRPPGLARPAPTGAAPPAPDAPSAPDIPPAPGMVDRLLVKMERKDPHGFFKDPVTDEVAPGYSEVIRRPMSFSQMRARLAAGEYATWPPVQEDLETMFNNAMVFNAPAVLFNRCFYISSSVARSSLYETSGRQCSRRCWQQRRTLSSVPGTSQEDERIQANFVKIMIFGTLAAAAWQVLPHLGGSSVSHAVLLLDASEPFMLRSGATRLKMLATSEDHVQRAVEAGAIRKLLRIVGSGNEPGVQVAALEALDVLTNADCGLKAFKQLGGSQVVMQIKDNTAPGATEEQGGGGTSSCRDKIQEIAKDLLYKARHDDTALITVD